MDDKILEDLKKELEDSIKAVENRQARMLENAMYTFSTLVEAHKERAELKEKLFRLKKHMDKQSDNN